MAFLRVMPSAPRIRPVRPARHEWDSAMPGRGEDRYGHFEAEPAPICDFDPVAVAMYRKRDEAQHAVYHRGAAVGDAAD